MVLTTVARFIALALALGLSDGFNSNRASFLSRQHYLSPQSASFTTSQRVTSLFPTRHQAIGNDQEEGGRKSLFRRVVNRFDTLESAGIQDGKVAGLGKRIKSLHNPITYLALALVAGLRLKWCFRNPYYWFGVAFCVKWYRARYVFKIPVWDRQPNWNNIITSKEQEKDLKAFTCKKCGSTIFIAKTREFFFEGNTGIGGLGCFSCGAKGKENFVMDRDRIVEDVADEDDYFEYERPLDFVSRAERRDLLKKAGGDEEKANELLVNKAATEGGQETTEAVNGKPAEEGILDAVIEEKTEAPEEEIAEAGVEEEIQDPENASAEPAEAPAVEAKEEPAKASPKPMGKKQKRKAKKKKPLPQPSDDDMDWLGMDDL